MFESLENRVVFAQGILATTLGDFSTIDDIAEFDDFQSVDGILFFEVDRSEFWRTQATPESTYKLADVLPDGDLVTVMGIDLFDVRTADGFSVWRTDGTPEGTFELIAGRRLTQRFVAESPTAAMLILATNEGYELWRSDGTQQGSHLRVTFNLGFEPRQIEPFRNTLLIRGDETASQQSILLAVTESNEVTIMRSDVDTLSSMITTTWGAMFTARDEEIGITKLYRTDGTPFGTQVVSQGKSIRDLRNVNDKLLFSFTGEADDFSVVRVADETSVLPLCECKRFWSWESVNGLDLFVASASSDEFDPALWATDGTTEGTHLIGRVFDVFFRRMGSVGGGMYFAIEDHLDTHVFWTDGQALRHEKSFFSAVWRVTGDGDLLINSYPDIYATDVYLAEADGLRKLTVQPLFELNKVIMQAAKLGDTWAFAGQTRFGGVPSVVQVEGEIVFETNSGSPSDVLLLQIPRDTSRSTALLRRIQGEDIRQRLSTDPLFFTADEQLFVVQDDGVAMIDHKSIDTWAPVEGGIVYAFTRHDETQHQIRFSDGTQVGSRTVLFDQQVEIGDLNLVQWQGKLLASAITANEGRELWVLEQTDDPPQPAGDLDGDQRVTFADFLIMSANFGKKVDVRADGDVDGNGRVDTDDFELLRRQFGNV